MTSPGLTSRSKGWYDPGMFAGVTSVKKNASTLEVPSKTISLIVPTNEQCKSDDCPFNDILGNSGFCPTHQRTWYPLKNNRGEDWHGQEFLCSISGCNRSCSCNMLTCKSAGYFLIQDALYVTKGGRDTVLKTPHLFSSEKLQDIKVNDRKIYLYAWHFFPDHLEKLDGIWKLKLHDQTG